MSAVRSIQVTSNTESLLKALSRTFTHSYTVVFELVQNAARAGASQVSLIHDPATRVLTVEDDGIGIADPSKLLAIAESGWDEAVTAENSPYGIGWISALFAAEEVEVESLNFQFRASTEDLLALKPVELKPGGRATGARISLRGLKASIGPSEIEAIQKRLEGFSIPVSFNGIEWARPHAIIDETTWVDTPEGKLRIALGNRLPVVYLQGMRFDSGWTRNAPTIIHLDPRKWFGRMPDRTELIDAARAERAVMAATAKAARDQLNALKAGMHGRDFVAAHADHCRTWGCIDLLNDIDWLPGSWLHLFDDLPRQSRYDDDDPLIEMSPAPVSGEQVGPIVLRDLDSSGDETDWAGMCYAWQARIPVLAVNLHPDHWVYTRSVEFEDFHVKVEEPGPEAPRLHYSGVWSYATLVRVSAIGINGPLGRMEMPTSAGLACADSILVTGDTNHYVLLQLNDYRDDDRHDEHVFDEDAATFKRAVRRLTGSTAPEETLRQALWDAGLETEVCEILKTSGPLVIYLNDTMNFAVMSAATPSSDK
ncbi:ATP-binding protein [Aquimonas sp.]|uniref:ATP-binding protein n=1 Tax=Aquimonas sp. TaxID=1872588 RepID=UPI0037C061BB